MINAKRIEIRDDPIDWAQHSVTFVSRTWLVSAGARSFGLGGSYRGPLRVEVAGPTAGRISIHDYTMMTRLAGAALFLIAAALRRIR